MFVVEEGCTPISVVSFIDCRVLRVEGFVSVDLRIFTVDVCPVYENKKISTTTIMKRSIKYRYLLRLSAEL